MSLLLLSLPTSAETGTCVSFVSSFICISAGVVGSRVQRNDNWTFLEIRDTAIVPLLLSSCAVFWRISDVENTKKRILAICKQFLKKLACTFLFVQNNSNTVAFAKLYFAHQKQLTAVCLNHVRLACI